MQRSSKHQNPKWLPETKLLILCVLKHCMSDDENFPAQCHPLTKRKKKDYVVKNDPV